jgi:hypothetical protein
METNYKSFDENYQNQLEDGQRYQDFLTKELSALGIIFQQYSSKHYQYTVGESHSRMEIKYDKKFSQTNNLWIEYQERKYPTGTYINSGILRDDNAFLWAQGDYNTLFIFCKRDLLHKLEGIQYIENNQKTSRGKLLRYPLTERYCGLKIRFNDQKLPEFETKDPKLKKIFSTDLPPIRQTGVNKDLSSFG